MRTRSEASMTQFWQQLTAQEREFWGTTPPPRRVRLRTALRGHCCLRTTVKIKRCIYWKQSREYACATTAQRQPWGLNELVAFSPCERRPLLLRKVDEESYRFRTCMASAGKTVDLRAAVLAWTGMPIALTAISSCWSTIMTGFNSRLKRTLFDTLASCISQGFRVTHMI